MPIDHQPHQQPRHNWVLFGFIAVAAFFLLTEHTAHVVGALPYLLLAACPLMHIFMHGGHGHGGHGSSDTSNESSKEKK
jgi:hypothetical protein